ncbi:Hypothetical predicted protein, partial [Olea europaea subsp. europaea]
MPLPGDRPGSSGADARRDSMRTISGGRRREPSTGPPETSTQQNINTAESLSNENHQDSVRAPARVSRRNCYGTTQGVEPRGRIKWTNEMNEFIVKEYFRITKINSNVSGFSEILRSSFIDRYPRHHNITKQNLIDRKNYLMKGRNGKRAIPQTTIDRLRTEIDEELTSNANNTQNNNNPI